MTTTPAGGRLALIACEAAQAALDLTRDDWGWFVALNGTVVSRDGDDAGCGRAEVALDRCRKDLAAVIRAALDRLLAPPCPTGITAERLAEIRNADDTNNQLGCVGHRRDLLAELDFVYRLLLDAEDGVAAYRAGVKAGEREGFARGWEQGAKAQHRDDVQHANEEAATFAEGEAGHAAAAADVAYAVEDAPLVVPPGGDEDAGDVQ